MIFSGHLVFTRRSHYKGSVRFCKTKPTANANEVALRLTFEIPDKLFTKPTLEARVVVPDISASASEITSEIIGDIEQAFKDKGIDIKVTLPINEIPQTP